MSQASGGFRAISLADLAALNDEIASLVRARVPLDRGLTGAAPELPRRLGAYTAELGRRMERGESLADAVSKHAGFPPVYRAIVAAGAKAGRLPVALEGLASSARRLAEVRRVVFMATLYPLFILLAAYTLFIVYLWTTLPTLLGIYGSQTPWLARQLNELRFVHVAWLIVLPTIVVLGYAVWSYRSGQALVLQPSRLFSWAPGMWRLQRASHASTMAEVLALLVEHEVPLHEGVPLAAEATGDPRLIASAKFMAEALQRGATPRHAIDEAQGMPPLLRWLVATGSERGALVPLLRSSADAYRRQALRSAERLRVALPMIMTICIGGTAVLAYGLSVFLPQIELLQFLNTWNFHP